MKLDCVKEKITEGINRVEKTTGKNLNLPILSCVLLKTDKNNLIIRSTNLDIGVEVSIPAKVHREGSVAVSGSILASFLACVKNEKNITLELVDGNLVIKTNSLSTTIKAQSSEDFPTLPQVGKEKTFTINPAVFVTGLKHVWYAASHSTVKPELASVYVHPYDDSLVFVSTDSFRLAEKKMRAKDVKDFTPVIIPSKNIGDIIRILETVDEDVEILFDKNQIAFEASGLYLVSRVIDGTFPDYRQIIPKNHSTEVIALKADVVDSFKGSNIFSDKFNQIHMTVLPHDKVFEIKTNNSDIGEYVQKVDSSLSGENIEMNFNHKYIADSFQSLDSDSISFTFNGQNKPLIIQGVSDKSFLYLVMPMNK